MPASFAKLRDGSWGLRIAGPAIEGSAVAVTKRDGTVSMETVGRVLWSGQGVTLATVAATGKRSRPGFRADNGAKAPGGRRCPYCGARDCPRAWNPRDLCQED